MNRGRRAAEGDVCEEDIVQHYSTPDPSETEDQKSNQHKRCKIDRNDAGVRTSCAVCEKSAAPLCVIIARWRGKCARSFASSAHSHLFSHFCFPCLSLFWRIILLFLTHNFEDMGKTSKKNNWRKGAKVGDVEEGLAKVCSFLFFIFPFIPALVLLKFHFILYNK